jgi:hypothetical protein
MDPAEALVFFLGGFSADPRRPFTGEGGPLTPMLDSSGSPVTNADGVVYAANDQRSDPLFPFKEQHLRQTRDQYANLMSTDEQTLHGGAAADNDPFPVYFPPGLETPYVYFDSRTYIHNPVNNLPTTPPSAALPPVYPPTAAWATTLVEGVARPYRSDTPRRVAQGAYDQVPFKWISEKTFQIVTSGLDNNYGANNFFKRFPSGFNYGLKDADGDGTVDTDSQNFDEKADHDNVCSFSEGATLGESMP